jgi:hypothetical protein
MITEPTELLPAHKQWIFRVTEEEGAPLEAFRKRKGWTRQRMFEEMRKEFCESHGLEFVNNGRRIA